MYRRIETLGTFRFSSDGEVSGGLRSDPRRCAPEGAVVLPSWFVLVRGWIDVFLLSLSQFLMGLLFPSRLVCPSVGKTHMCLSRLGR